MSIKHRLVALAALAVVGVSSGPAVADDHAYTEGPVVNVARIRTIDGHFDDYMKWLDTSWKKMQETAKKLGYITDYQVLANEPRGPEDADVLLVVTYKNWAALDGAIEKGDNISKAVEGSVAAANQSEADRAKIRTVLGSSTLQVLQLK